MDSLILHKGLVTHVIDPSSFWMRMGTDADFQVFEEYQHALDKFYNGTGRTDIVNADILTIGDCVIVADTSQKQISNDDDDDEDDDENKASFHWNRARVARIDEGKVDVFYIDLGYTEIVHMSRINNINSDLFYYLPSQVIQLKLAGIRPLTRSWTSRAVNLFASRVLDQEVLVSLIDYDELGKYGQVVIYIQLENYRWRCLTHDMLDEDLGLPVEPLPEEFLSQEEVIAALARGEQDSSLNACGLEASRNNDIEGVPHETESRENISVPEPRPPVPSLEPDQHLRLESFPAPTLPDPSSSSHKGVAAQVPAFDLSSFVHTKSLSIPKMHEDKVEERHMLNRTILGQNSENSEEEEVEEQEIDWGKSDLLIGEADVFSDFDIRQEIYKHHSDHPSENDLREEFLYKGAGVHKEIPATKSSSVEKEDTHRDSSEKVNLKPLTEIEDYEIQKKIEEILSGKDSGELNMVCVLMNSFIEPDVTIPCDRLVAVFTAILERMVRNSDTDPLIAFGALETYLGTSAFETAMDTVLKTLRSNFVKLPRTKHSSNYHCAFAELLVILFIHAGNWPLSSCSLIHEFVMASLERWIVFNKQRIQNSDSTVGVERLFLECVEVFIDGAGETLSQRFPDRCCSLLEEIKYKLLHDDTQRNIREQLLNILLKLHQHVPLNTPKKTSVHRDSNVQTGVASTKESEVLGKTQRAVEEDMTIVNNLDSHGLQARRGPPSTGSSDAFSDWSDEDGEAAGYSLTSADPVFNTHSLYSTGMVCDMDSGDSVAAGNLVDTGASSHSLLTVGNEAIQRGSPHLQKELFNVDGFKDYTTAEDTRDESQQHDSDHLNASITELTSSASENALEQKRQKQRQFDCRLEAHATEEERHDEHACSKPFIVKTAKHNKVHKLNISAPEFTPQLSSSWGELDQLRMCLSSVDVPGCETYKDAISEAANSELKSVQCNVENENSVTDVQEKEEESSFLEIDKEETVVHLQKDASWNNEDTVITGSPSFSDVEEVPEHSSPFLENAVEPRGVIHQEKIIRYTPQELKALNPGALGCLIDLDVARDSSLANDVIKKSECLPDEQEIADLKSSPSSVPYLRYTGQGGSPLELSVGPKSNSAKWKSLSELLPPSQLRPRQFTSKLSAHPPPFSCDITDSEPHASEKDNLNSLCSIAQSLFSSSDQPVSEKPYLDCNTSSNVSNAVPDENLNTEAVETFENAEPITVPDLNDIRHHMTPQWPESFFKNVGSVEDWTQSTSIDKTLSPKKTNKHKAKKKTKFRPVSEVLAEKSHTGCHENKVPLSDGNDEGCRIETEIDDGEVGGHVIHQPTLGALCSSSSKRSSWLTELRQERPKADKWVPGRRKCTRCGSTDHTIYDCSQEDPFQKLSNHNDFW